MYFDHENILFELQPCYNLGTRSISVYWWGGGGGSLILGAYAKGKSPSFRCPVAEYGYVISTCTVFLLFKLMQT